MQNAKILAITFDATVAPAVIIELSVVIQRSIFSVKSQSTLKNFKVK